MSLGPTVVYNRFFAITPSDTVNFTDVQQQEMVGLYVGGAGNAVIVMGDDTTITLSGLLAGTIYPMRCKRINSTNTTATLLRGLLQV